MYPNLYFFLKETFQIEPWKFTMYINSFGLLVAISFVLAAFTLSLELKRKEKMGLIFPKEELIEVGKGPVFSDLFFNFIFGFIVGYKIIGVFFNSEGIRPQDYIFSMKGSVVGGILLGGLFGGVKYIEQKKQQLAKPEKRTIRIWPHERVGDVTIIAAIFGFLGAKIFDNLENLDRFIENPIGNLLSPSGLTFYGGLICATLALMIYAKRKNIPFIHLCDAAAPGLMLSYATGRIGCHVSGDGDWGIFNSGYSLDKNGEIVKATTDNFKDLLAASPDFSSQLIQEYGSVDQIPHTFFHGSSFLPNWFWAYNYPHNVNEVGTTIQGCVGNYCSQLSPLVFPTPLYEFIAGFLVFMILWTQRKKMVFAGQMFGIYLIFNGLERFLVEKIRVNSTYTILGFHPTQAELISILLIAGGALLLARKKSTMHS